VINWSRSLIKRRLPQLANIFNFDRGLSLVYYTDCPLLSIYKLIDFIQTRCRCKNFPSLWHCLFCTQDDVTITLGLSVCLLCYTSARIACLFQLNLECVINHQVKHSYLISVLEGVLSATALDAFSLVKVVNETGRHSFLCPRTVPMHWLL